MRGVACLQVIQLHTCDMPYICLLCTLMRDISTCHVVLSKEYYEKTISDGEPSDEENDLLDLACVNIPYPSAFYLTFAERRYGLTQTSRLGCQVKLTPSMNGMQVTSPHVVPWLALAVLFSRIPFDFPSNYSSVQAARGHSQLLCRRPQAQASLKHLAEGTRALFQRITAYALSPSSALPNLAVAAILSFSAHRTRVQELGISSTLSRLAIAGVSRAQCDVSLGL